jgi:hypothetical protein
MALIQFDDPVGVSVHGHNGRVFVNGSSQIPKYRCCRSGSAINCAEVPLHTARPRSMM